MCKHCEFGRYPNFFQNFEFTLEGEVFSDWSAGAAGDPDEGHVGGEGTETDPREGQGNRGGQVGVVRCLN